MSTTAPARTLMEADMSEQPAVLARLVEARPALHAAFRAAMPKPLRGIAIVGRGSSANAGLYGRLLLEIVTRRPVTLVPPSLVRLYGLRTDLEGYLAIGLSQSGRTAEVAESLAAMRSCGAVPIAVTSDRSSAVAGAADLVVDLGTGPERAIPATKTFSAELAAIAMISEALDGAPRPPRVWEATVRAVEVALGDAEPARRAAARIRDAEQLSVVAAGMLVGVAHEAALKTLEVARIAALGWSSQAFRHGPMTLAGPKHPVVAIAVQGRAGADVLRTVSLLDGTPVVLVADTPDADLPVLGGLPEELAAIPAAVRAQQLALYAALRRGVDPDRPPRLTKVVPA